MPEDYGAAQPIIDVAKSAYDKVSSFLGGADKALGTHMAPPPPDTKMIDSNYQKDMLSKANDSFAKGADASMRKISPPSVTITPSMGPKNVRRVSPKSIPGKR